MNNHVLIKLVIAIGVILGVAYWLSYNPSAGTENISEANGEPHSSESSVGSNGQKLNSPTTQSSNIPVQNTYTDAESTLNSQVLYEFEEHGTAAYLNARDQISELAKGYEVIRFELIKINQNALVKIVRNDANKSQLDQTISLPLFEGKSCDIKGRNHSDHDSGKRIRFHGVCQGYGTFSGGHRTESDRYSFLIKAGDQSSKYVIKSVNNEHALLIQVVHIPQPVRQRN